MKKQKLAAVLTAIMLVYVGTALLSHHVNAAADGSISGSVKLSGTAPHMKGIDMSKDPYCVKQNPTPQKMENVMVGANGGLQNVVLYLSEGLAGAGATPAASQEPAVDQHNCMYTPHV